MTEFKANEAALTGGGGTTNVFPSSSPSAAIARHLGQRPRMALVSKSALHFGQLVKLFISLGFQVLSSLQLFLKKTGRRITKNFAKLKSPAFRINDGGMEKPRF